MDTWFSLEANCGSWGAICSAPQLLTRRGVRVFLPMGTAVNATELTLNRIAQKQLTLEEGVEWFRTLSSDGRANAIERLRFFCHQSHPTDAEKAQAIELSGLRATHTPCVLLLKFSLGEALLKIVGLPEQEHERVFRLIVAVLTVADTRRRRTECKGGCYHGWHNLPDAE